MPNLYSTPISVPKINAKQEKALKDWLMIEKQKGSGINRMANLVHSLHGNFGGGLSCLNDIPKEDLYYVVITGQYEVEITYEEYLAREIDKWSSEYNAADTDHIREYYGARLEVSREHYNKYVGMKLGGKVNESI